MDRVLRVSEKNAIEGILKDFMKSKVIGINGEWPKGKRHITFINCSTQF